MLGRHALVEAMGVRVIEVPDLRSEVALVRDQGVALIRAGLDEAVHATAVSWLVQQVAQPASQPR